MSYRVETASSGRAGCIATECKAAGIKIDKDELRFGVWVEIMEHGSWRWKHWGCVTGAQIGNLRDFLADPANPGTYRWDYLDGYSGEEKNSLDKHPDLQEKVRRAVEQGHVDDEDFNGDIEMNKPGEKGLYSAATKKRRREEKKARANETAELQANLARVSAERDTLIQSGSDEKPTKKKIAGKKRVKDESEDEGVEEKPAKKKRAPKAKKEEGSDEENTKPAGKSKGRKAMKKEGDEASEADEKEVMPAPSKRARVKKGVKKDEDSKGVKNEDGDESTQALDAIPKKRATRGKKVIKDEAAEDNDATESSTAKAPAKKGRKKAVKQEASEDMTMSAGVDSSIKGEPSDAIHLPAINNKRSRNSALANAGSATTGNNENSQGTDVVEADDETIIPGIKNIDLQATFDNAVAAGEFEGDFEAFVEQKEAKSTKTKTKKKASRPKKSSAVPTRTSRSRTVSKA